jgi:hypothetical protein
LFFLFGSAVFISCDNSGSNFAVKDIENITRIELSDRDNQLILSKTEDVQWLVSSFPANMRNISNLKKILADIEVQYPLPKMYNSAYSNEKITSEGIYIKAFKGKNVMKSYYLLFTDTEGVETIGLMEGSQKPFVLKLPGQDIDFSDYIVAEQGFWENNILFSFKPGEIKYIKIDNKEDPNNSFSVKIADSISLFDTNGKDITFDKNKMSAYLSYFGNISFDSNLNISEDEKQKIISIEPLYTITIESSTENTVCYIIPIIDNNIDDYGNSLVYNRDFFNIVIPQKNIFAKARWLEFDILLEELNYFID